MKISKKMRNDIILVAIILAISLVGLLALRLTAKQGSYAVVKISGEVVAEYPLSMDGEYTLNGGTNILVIEGGRAYMKWANCPKQICISHGIIWNVGQFIECAHNKVDIIIVDY